MPVGGRGCGPGSHSRRLRGRTDVADGRNRRLAADHDRRPSGRIKFVGGIAARPSCGLLPVHTQPRLPNFPDPVRTPSGGYGYRTTGIDPNSAAFQGALKACKALPSPWNSTGQQLSPAQQQAWLTWAQCIRAHGVPDFPDPTFSGMEVHDAGIGSSSPQLQSAMDACKSQRPSVGGLGG